jgi:hypothetical protein
MKCWEVMEEYYTGKWLIKRQTIRKCLIEIVHKKISTYIHSHIGNNNLWKLNPMREDIRKLIWNGALHSMVISDDSAIFKIYGGSTWIDNYIDDLDPIQLSHKTKIRIDVPMLDVLLRHGNIILPRIEEIVEINIPWNQVKTKRDIFQEVCRVSKTIRSEFPIY